MDYTVIGDHVNLACRLCDAAGAGEIIISENTKNNLSKNKFNLTKQSSLQLKGIEKPVVNYRVE